MVAIALSLTACATTPVQFDPEALIPAALTQCMPEPPVPPRPAAGLPRGDDVVSGYIADLHDAYGDCKATVDAIAKRRALLDEQASKAKGGLHLHNPFTKKPAHD